MGTIMNIRRGGGATGCTLEVTGVKTGDTVLLQKGDKSYTKTLDSDKKAMFRGLTGGTWTAKMSDGMWNVQREVEITDNYEMTMKFFEATISVTYPVGSTCTCTFSFEGQTIKTYTAPDTSGSYTFTVPNAADWVISCTNGTQTASKTVSITQDEQSESVTLTYELALFDGGSVNEDITGGWSGNMAQDQLGTDKYLYLQSYGYYNTSTVTAKKITVTDYNTLKVNVTAYTRDNANAWVGLANAANEDNYKSPVLRISPTASGTPAEYNKDISALSGEYYVFVFAEGYWDSVPAAHTCNIKIDKIILV